MVCAEFCKEFLLSMFHALMACYAFACFLLSLYLYCSLLCDCFRWCCARLRRQPPQPMRFPLFCICWSVTMIYMYITFAYSAHELPNGAFVINLYIIVVLTILLISMNHHDHSMILMNQMMIILDYHHWIITIMGRLALPSNRPTNRTNQPPIEPICSNEPCTNQANLIITRQTQPNPMTPHPTQHIPSWPINQYTN